MYQTSMKAPGIRLFRRHALDENGSAWAPTIQIVLKVMCSVRPNAGAVRTSAGFQHLWTPPEIGPKVAFRDVERSRIVITRNVGPVSKSLQVAFGEDRST